jgi:predicted helicase
VRGESSISLIVTWYYRAAYRVSTDPCSGIVNDPNRPYDDHYILRLIGQVITVSLETQQIIATLPSLNFPN